MKERIKEFLAEHLLFDVFGLTSIGLLITSFFMPPQGVIDPSVIAATGELFAWGALVVLFRAIRSGKKATVTKGDTSLTVEDEHPRPIH